MLSLQGGINHLQYYCQAAGAIGATDDHKMVIGDTRDKTSQKESMTVGITEDTEKPFPPEVFEAMKEHARKAGCKEGCTTCLQKVKVLMIFIFFK